MHIKYKEYAFDRYIDNKEIENKCRELAKKINISYKGEIVVFVGVLNGCIPFMSTLLKYIEIPYKYNFIRVASYYGIQSKELKMHLDIYENNVKNENIIVVEDIVDSGKTIKFIEKHINKMNPKSYKVISLLTKVDVSKIIDWYGFIIDDKFVIGYGMDIDNNYRYLKDIYILNEKETKK